MGPVDVLLPSTRLTYSSVQTLYIRTHIHIHTGNSPTSFRMSTFVVEFDWIRFSGNLTERMISRGFTVLFPGPGPFSRNARRSPIIRDNVGVDRRSTSLSLLSLSLDAIYLRRKGGDKWLGKELVEFPNRTTGNKFSRIKDSPVSPRNRSSS